MDPSSLANLEEIATEKVVLNVCVDFDRKVLSGHADLHFAVKKNTSSVVLDTRDLTIQKAELLPSNTDLKFVVEAPHAALGSALRIALPEESPAGSKLSVRIHFETSPTSTAIQWLEPSQTAGKKHPFLFTQCQAIHARSLLPCQDSPAIKASYEATVQVPAPLVAKMSAIDAGSEPSADGSATIFKFKQDVPIPSYLIALAVGALVGKDVGPRSAVWSEAETVDAGVHEFAETEQFIQVAESFLPAYAWGRYDILLLPPSFPYGGMENPCLTFVTPTLLAGDRSLATVVAHEIAHSWSGNLVTNSNWEHFWLNEGFTMFIERKILGRMQGEHNLQFDSLLGLNSLKDEVEHFGCSHQFTALIPKLSGGADPDDAFSSVPYEKGYNFVYYLQTVVGGPAEFEPWMKSYFDKFKYQSIDSEAMKAYFLEWFTPRIGAEKLSQIDWNAWFNTPGMPIVENTFDKTLADGSARLAELWKNGGEGATADDLKGWTTRQIVYFLETLAQIAPSISHSILEKMDRTYNLSTVKNSEVRFRWQQLCLKAEYEPIYPHVVAFLLEQGRMKFVRPLYRELFKTKAGKDLAVATFKANKGIYHGIAQKMVAKDLSIDA